MDSRESGCRWQWNGVLRCGLPVIGEAQFAILYYYDSREYSMCLPVSEQLRYACVAVQAASELEASSR